MKIIIATILSKIVIMAMLTFNITFNINNSEIKEIPGVILLTPGMVDR